MIYRCTARFVRSYDQLPAEARASVAQTLRQDFAQNPRMPTADTHIVRGAESEVYTLRVGKHIQLTFAYGSDPNRPNDFVCIFRNVGMV